MRKLLLTKNIQDLKIKGKNVIYNNKLISQIELCGTCIENNAKYFKFLDFLGEIGVVKKKDLQIPQERIRIFCKLYIKDDKINLYCTGYEKVNIFESMFFTVESINLSKFETR